MQIQGKRRSISADVLFDGHDTHENSKLIERIILLSPVKEHGEENDVEDLIAALKALEIRKTV